MKIKGEKAMKIKLVDYADVVTEFEIDDKKLKNFLFAQYKVVSGDEILLIIYKDGSEDYFDSCHSIRIQSFPDDEISLIDVEELLLIKKLRTKARKGELCFTGYRADSLEELVDARRNKIEQAKKGA